MDDRVLVRELLIWACGCYSDRIVKGPDEITHTMEMCGACFDHGIAYLESLAKTPQLTLDLASQRERHGAEND